GGRVLGHLQRLGFPGEVWGVNPRLPMVEGIEIFPSVRSLPAAPDVLVCAVPASSVLEVAREAGEIGAGVVIVFAGGFAEAGADGQQLQRHLVEVAKATGIRVLGPNSGGVIRPTAGVALSFLTCLDRPVEQIRSGPVGLVTQSGGTGSHLHNLAAARGSGFAASISTGNEADLDVADALDALIEQPDVASIALVLETVRRGPEFLASIRRARHLGKPVVVCRLGRSERGRQLMITHTGALARPGRVLDGVLDAEGVIMAETPGDLLEIAEVMARAPVPAGNRTAVVSHSGGIAILLSDLAEKAGVVLPAPGPELRHRLQPLLELGAADNPLDMGGIIGGPHRFGEVVRTFVDSDDYDLVLAVSTAHPPLHTLTRVQDLVDIESSKAVVNLWMAGDLGEKGLALLRAAQVPVAEEPRAAMAALAGLARLAALKEDPRIEHADPVSATVGGQAGEHESKLFLEGLGIPVVEGGLARSAEEAVVIAGKIGFPVVVKVSSAGIAHKTEIGGLQTGIGDDEALRRAYDLVMAAGKAVPGVTIDGVRVERHRSGLELIVGAVRDPTFGPIALLGLGGIYTESLDDVAVAPAPVTASGAMRMMARWGGRRVLSSARQGRPPDVEALAAIVARVGGILVSSQLEEIELNPLVWTGEGWEALDALVRGPTDPVSDSTGPCSGVGPSRDR
ncbi:MAG: acetate--CoA ligase family protein, partial [Acidimicrobiia bacterium]|nr:acetate--CoA ligase family protein [Acidimicrobiia bacterium]